MTEEETRKAIDDAIETYIAKFPTVQVGSEKYDRRTIPEFELLEGAVEIEKETFFGCVNLSSINYHLLYYLLELVYSLDANPSFPLSFQLH